MARRLCLTLLLLAGLGSSSGCSIGLNCGVNCVGIDSALARESSGLGLEVGRF